jgi:hypothetical protein
MEAILKEEVAARWTKAQNYLTEGRKWAAFKAFEGLTLYYKAYPEASKAMTEMGKLTRDKAVARELQAKMMLDKIQEWAHSPRKTDRDLIKPGLAQLNAGFADTEAGRAAATINLIDKDKQGDAQQAKT